MLRCQGSLPGWRNPKPALHKCPPVACHQRNRRHRSTHQTIDHSRQLPKKMRSLFLTVAILTVCSCSFKDSDKSNSIELNQTNISDNQDIFGNWVMCATSDGKTMTQMNVCPIISFESSGTGYVKNGTIISNIFTWNLRRNRLEITEINDNSDPFFLQKTYNTIFQKLQNKINLQLQNDSVSLYLTRFLQRWRQATKAFIKCRADGKTINFSQLFNIILGRHIRTCSH